MPPIPVVAGTIVRVTLEHNLGNGRHADCILDVSVDEGIAGDRATSVANAALAVGEKWQDDIAVALSANISYTGGKYTDLDSLEGVSGAFGPSGGHPINSGVNTSLHSPQTAVLVHKFCHHSRSQRNGRLFLPAVAEANVDDFGNITPSQITYLNGRFALLLSAINGSLISGADTALRVVHVTGHTGVPEPGFPQGKPNAWDSSDVTSFGVDQKVATQRRRNRA